MGPKSVGHSDPLWHGNESKIGILLKWYGPGEFCQAGEIPLVRTGTVNFRGCNIRLLTKHVKVFSESRFPLARDLGSAVRNLWTRLISLLPTSMSAAAQS